MRADCLVVNEHGGKAVLEMILPNRNGKDRDAVELAVRVGSFAVQRPGTQPSYPYPDDELPGAIT